MESYLKNTLGIHVDIQTWNDINTLPDELKQDKDYLLIEIHGIKCLVIKQDVDDFQLSIYQKEKELLQQYCQLPQVLCFDRITAYQRKCLIENGQPFIVPDNQLYMPFLGISLQERFKAPTIVSQTLTAMAQYILLFFLYQKEQKYFSKLDISKILDVNLMNISRGVQELESFSLLITKKKGRSSMVTSPYNRKELFEKALPYMRNPVQKKLFVKEEEWLHDLPIAGEAAKCQTSEYVTRAIEKKVFLENADRITTVDPAWDTDVTYLELEVWRYDPTRFTDGKNVDSISYVLSLKGDDDGAVELNIDELL